MTRRRHVTMAAATTAATLTLAGALGAPPSGAQAGCTPLFDGGSTYLSRLCGMPDYDQRRTAGILQGDGRTFNESALSIAGVNFSLALPGNGGCHCVPTSFTNLLGYYVRKGVQGSFPNNFNWDSRAGYVARPDIPANTYLNGQALSSTEVSAYNRATFAIKTLGQAVKTGDAGCGTSWSTVLGYFSALRSLYPKVYMSISTSTPGFNGPKQVANILAAGGTVAIAYGRYGNYTENNGIASWGSRNGGHAVTVREVSGSGANAQFKLSDPAGNNDPVENGDTDRFRQSLTSDRVVPLTRVFNPGQIVFRWRFGAINSSGNTGIWDSMLVAYPVMAIMTNGNSVQMFPGWSFNQQGTAAAHAAQDPSIPSELKPKSIGLGTRTNPVLDAALLPATGEIAYIRKGDGSVRAITVGTRERRVIGVAPKGASQLETDPTGAQLFVGGSTEIVRFDPGSEKGDPVKLKAPAAVQALSFDPGTGIGNGRLVAITANRQLHRLTPDKLTQVGSPQTLSKSLLAGSGRLAAAVDPKGRLLLRRGSSSRLGRVTLQTRSVGRGTVNALEGNGGLAIGERGTLFTVIGGRIAELTPGGSKASNSPLNGLRASGRVLQVTRGGSSLPAGMADEIVDQRVVDPDFPEMAP